MRFEPSLIQATLLKRYKRFLADVRLESGEEITVHCPNTGSMKNCLVPDSRCWLSDSNNPKRKYRYSLELVTTPLGALACVNTQRANQLVKEALEAGRIKPLEGYSDILPEQKYGQENSRIDFLLRNTVDAGEPSNGSQSLPDCYVEVKSVTMETEADNGAFPDAVTQRGTKHLRELLAIKQSGQRAVLLFCVPHSGIKKMCAAEDIDPLYAQTLREAKAEGVEIYVYGVKFLADEWYLDRALEFFDLSG